MKINNKWKVSTLVLVVIALLLGVALGTVWVQREIQFHAFIESIYDMQIYQEVECINIFNFSDFGGYGAGSKEVYGYLKCLGNDVIYVTWKLTSGSGWYYTGSLANYSNGVFNFQVLGYMGTVPWLPLDDANPKYRAMGADAEPFAILFKCYTSEFLAHDTSWSVTFFGDDTPTGISL